MKKVVVAMSGGVDSSVAASLLKDEGYQVTGITMQIWPPDRESNSGSCGSTGAIEDALKVADSLGIPHHVMNLRDIFTRKVIADFCEEYRRGHTPNPCVRCNRYVKFGALLDKARELGADFIATGHHARVEKDDNKEIYLLKKGVDRQKDQSYFLYLLEQKQLGHILMPVGNITKKEVREIARGLKLPVAAKAESQEICFIPDDDYPEFVKDYIPQAAEPGPILNENGDILGSHRGILYYTIGQRKGLGIAAGEPLYVIAIEPERNAVVVGKKEKVFGDELIASRLNWIAGDRPTRSITAKARIRYRHPEADATITPLDKDRVQVKFAEPQMAITPGQAVVFYDGDVVIGGGTIDPARQQDPCKTTAFAGEVKKEKEFV